MLPSFRNYVIFLSAVLLLSGVSAKAEETTPLRIITFNTEILTAPGMRAGQVERYRFDFARGEHHERVADIIEVLRPDIVNLLEATSKESVDLVVKILHEKGLTEYTGYHVESNDSYTGMDVSCITRLKPDKIDGKEIRTYFSPGDDPTWRQAYSFTSFSGSRQTGTSSISRNGVYFFTVNGHKLGFLGLHLKSNPEDEYSNAQRTAEAEVARRIIRGEIEKRGYMPIVLGDLNDYDPDVPDADDTRAPKTKVLASLKDYDSEKPGAELVNVAERIPRAKDRYTSHWDWNENGARDPQDVYTMIDHILLPKELMPYVDRAFIARCVGLETSDHYPVVVDLKLPAKE
ncbi:endonuclease/exonuclease/phosphatase family protein [Aeoliella sp. SH292]|uniref:endonuclease/exonuclease/phosphatase family protein n=1 Tax=Aeoliella sp. SH292 TaxID=3454464 RepID=UPI003F967AB0